MLIKLLRLLTKLVTFRLGRWHYGILLLISSVLVFFGVQLLADGETVTGLMVVSFFGGCALFNLFCFVEQLRVNFAPGTSVDQLSSEAADEIVLWSSNREWIVILLASLGMTAAGIFMIFEPRAPDAVGWLVAVSFGLCAVVSFLVLVRGGQVLKVDREGIHMRSINMKTHTCKLADISEIKVVRIGGREMVGMDFSESYKEALRGMTARLSSWRLGGVDGALPDTYGLPAEKLALLLERYKQRFTSLGGKEGGTGRTN